MVGVHAERYHECARAEVRDAFERPVQCLAPAVVGGTWTEREVRRRADPLARAALLLVAAEVGVGVFGGDRGIEANSTSPRSWKMSCVPLPWWKSTSRIATRSCPSPRNISAATAAVVQEAVTAVHVRWRHGDRVAGTGRRRPAPSLRSKPRSPYRRSPRVPPPRAAARLAPRRRMTAPPARCPPCDRGLGGERVVADLAVDVARRDAPRACVGRGSRSRSPRRRSPLASTPPRRRRESPGSPHRARASPARDRRPTVLPGRESLARRGAAARARRARGARTVSPARPRAAPPGGSASGVPR